MNLLRWILGPITVLAAAGFVGLVLLANAARAVLNQPAHGPSFILLPVAGITLLLAAIIFPNRQPLLHAAAVAAVGLAFFFGWQTIDEGAGVWRAFAYLAAWFFYYYLAAWRVRPQA